MNVDKSWTVKYRSKILRTVENHECGSQDSNNVETKMNLHVCIGKLLPSRCGEITAFSKSSSGCSGSSSNPMSIHPRTNSIYIMKEIHREDRIWTMTPG